MDAGLGTGGGDGGGQGVGVGDVGACHGQLARDGREPVQTRLRGDGGDDLVTTRNRKAGDSGADEAAGTGHEQARGDAHDLLIGSLDE